MEVNVIAPVTATASTPAEAVVSALVAMVKPPVVAGRAPPKVSPTMVICLEEVPEPPLPPVVNTMVVLPADKVGVEAIVTGDAVATLDTVPTK